jgi:Domain of unknown function (DUF6265)
MIAALMLAVAVLPQGSPSVADLAWLAGCWESTRGDRHVIEQWMAPEGGTLLGMSRTVANGKTTEYEVLLIREGARGLEFVAKPSGQAEATFTSVRVSATEVVFENPAHDFPTRIIYQRQSDGVTAAIEGLMNGQSRRIEFPYRPATCGK